MTTPLQVAARVKAPKVDRYESSDDAYRSARYWRSLRKRVQAGASLRNVRPSPASSR